MTTTTNRFRHLTPSRAITAPRVRRGTSRRLLPVALALTALPAALAAPAPDLRGATLCLSPMTTVFISAESGLPVGLSTLETQVYAELKSVLRAGGVKYREEHVCKQASADLTLALTVRPIRGSPAVETQVSARVEDETGPGASFWLGGELRWSAVAYGKVGPAEAEVRAELLTDTRSLLTRLVGEWKAANR